MTRGHGAGVDVRLTPRGEGSIQASKLQRSFKDTAVLQGIDIGVAPGQMAALVGPNGSGKTTALRILAGTLSPDGGSVLVAGGPPGRGLAGYVVAGDRGLYWRLTALHNLEFFAGISGLGGDEARACARGALQALDASALGGRRVEVCSTGQRRRIAIARGFVARPPVVLVDEPFADLDEQGCAAVGSLMRRWADEGGAVLYAAPLAGEGPAPDLVFEVAGGRVAATAGA